ncbi:4-alpha-glucanotransferase [Vibrio sagamiensis]|uniref:4-alpha-glucanotransferase n=1 Tax=Vibrio sagamiensis NBRC 104589 TaxID=1219064 RepID=A0A511QDP1_9VIBR|nr:4-alpha-glucanotransferase [Vibrio sagamiensis]PNQ65187.1 4-alpha-glucanotransferase [Vibrio agarivorans]GEM75306.1 4-alpha-glucanotransferase [Vibrio sagamiensis NBRC 104589]
MKAQTVLQKAAESAQLSERYVTAWGEEVSVPHTTLISLLSSLGYDVTNEETLLKSLEKKQKKEVLAPVLVLRDNEPIEIELSLGKSARGSDFSWRLNTEQGECFEGYLQSQIIRDERAQGGELVFSLPQSLPWGYHKLTLFRKRRKAPYEMSLIITPQTCFKQAALEQDKKLWGPSIQLYTLRSVHNWGIGDFGDLKQLVSDIGSRGGDFIGLNPIHSLFPANPESASPYSPSSRRWLNIMYIDVSSVPEFVLSTPAQQLVGSTDFQQRLRAVRESHWVNYSEVSALKMSVLPLLYQEFKVRHLDNNTSRAQAFLDFVEQGGESLLCHATFDALHSSLRAKDPEVWGWPVFPDKYRKFEAVATQKFIKESRDTVHLYMYLQWIADEQIREAQVLAMEKGMQVGLYRDLAVGVADSGSEAWADHGRNLVLGASIGAPPDILGPQGQNWGLPPFNPQALESTGFEAFIQLLRANMKYCGALRIDHILGLLRLWWIPKGQKATEGAYLYYPVKQMLSILALESHRQQCSVIGEDLGTVPEEIVTLLQEAGVYSYKVFFFETSEHDGGFISPKHYAAQAMATLCTHDMPTLRGFWHCDDLKIGQEIGLYQDKPQLDGLFDDRLNCKQGILDSVFGHGYLPEGVGRDAQYVPMDGHLAEALQLHLAAGNSAFLSVQLEDWLEMDKPVNIPGTVDEYPNWRRKLSINLDEIFSREQVNRLAQRLTEVRAQVAS